MPLHRVTDSNKVLTHSSSSHNSFEMFEFGLQHACECDGMPPMYSSSRVIRRSEQKIDIRKMKQQKNANPIDIQSTYNIWH